MPATAPCTEILEHRPNTVPGIDIVRAVSYARTAIRQYRRKDHGPDFAFRNRHERGRRLGNVLRVDRRTFRNGSTLYMGSGSVLEICRPAMC